MGRKTGKHRGRPPKSREERAAEGGNVVDLFAGAPDTKPLDLEMPAPEGMTVVGREKFVELRERLESMGLAKDEDVDTIWLAATWWTIIKKYDPRIVGGSGAVQTYKSGATAPSGHFVVWKDAMKTYDKLLCDLGMNPSARAGLHKPGQSDEDDDEFLENG